MLKLRNVFHTVINSRALQGKHVEDGAKGVTVKSFIETSESSKVISQKAVQSEEKSL